VLRGRDMQDIEELKRQGLSIRAISQLTGYDRKTFETPLGKQAQVDWGHLGTIEMDGRQRALNGFAFTLGYSRTMMAEAALDQKLGTLLKMHEEAFRQLGGVPEEIL